MTRLEKLETLAAQALEFSAHAVSRRAILPRPDQLSRDAAHAIALYTIELQLTHLRKIGYNNIADLFDPHYETANKSTHEFPPCYPKDLPSTVILSPKQRLPLTPKSDKTPPPAA